MKRALFLAVAALVAVAPASTEAQLYNGNPPTSAAFDFVSAAGSVAGTFGVMVGPYTGNFLDDSVGAFSIYCVDYLHYAKDMSRVNVSQVSGDLSLTRLNDATRYGQSAYLSSLFDSWADYSNGGALSRQTVFSGLHAAIWQVTSGEVLGGDGQVGAVRDDFLAMAVTGAATMDLSEWYVITEDGVTDGFGQGRFDAQWDGKGQEFLMRRASVPEPGTVLLILTGVVMLLGVGRKRVLDLGDL